MKRFAFAVMAAVCVLFAGCRDGKGDTGKVAGKWEAAMIIPVLSGDSERYPGVISVPDEGKIVNIVITKSRIGYEFRKDGMMRTYGFHEYYQELYDLTGKRQDDLADEDRWFSYKVSTVKVTDEDKATYSWCRGLDSYIEVQSEMKGWKLVLVPKKVTGLSGDVLMPGDYSSIDDILNFQKETIEKLRQYNCPENIAVFTRK